MRNGATAGILALVVVASAAGARAADIDVGVKGGFNLATLSGAGLVEQITQQLDRQDGLVGGVFVRIPVGSRLAVQPEALYSRKGAKVDLPIGEVGIALDYLELGLPLRADLMETSSIRPYLFAGPYAGVKLNAELALRVIINIDTDIDERVRDTDFGVLGGGGLRFDAGSTNLDLEARYSWGLTRVNEDLAGQDVKNRVLSVLAGVSF